MMTATPHSTGQGADAASQIERGVRAVVIEHVRDHPESRVVLAARLAVPAETIDKLLSRDTWDLSLALAAATELGVRLHVSRA